MKMQHSDAITCHCSRASPGYRVESGTAQSVPLTRVPVHRLILCSLIRWRLEASLALFNFLTILAQHVHLTALADFTS